MSQINKYTVHKILPGTPQQVLTEKDGSLITSYSLGAIPFLSDKYQLNASFFTPDGLFLETKDDIKTYTVLGVNQGEDITEISVNPVQDALDRGYLGDVQVEYTVTNNLFSPSHSLDPEAVLFIREISVDRTELRATSTTLSENQLQEYAQNLYQKLNSGAYFEGATLDFLDDGTTSWCLNVMTEVLDGTLIVTFKTYEPLPENVGIKSRFTVLEQIGEPTRFEVIRTVEVLEDEDTSPRLKGPNFDVQEPSTELGTVTDYLNFQELFSYPEVNQKLDLYSIYREQGIELDLDHSNFGNFIHFSSAAERLENFRYKLGLIQGYEHELEQAVLEAERARLRSLIQGIIDNFDHYDRYLYFENTETAWPKQPTDKPYKNVPVEEATTWFEWMLGEASSYDESNPDILINTIPKTIRQDTRNEPYLVFVHMIGQQFDDEWLYAKAVSNRYSGDNRLNFGIPKDLVREALKSFGVELETTNQNLEKLFELCVPGQSYNTGSEATVTNFEQITADYGSEFQPVFIDDYRKELYKRIYHNIPLLLKTKGTTRGLRALISCFGIPEDLLEISVEGGANLDQPGAFFGPEYYTTSSQGRITVDNTGSRAPLMFDEETGLFISGTLLSLYKQIQQPGQKYQQGINNVNVGFRLNSQLDQQVKSYLTSTSADFDYDSIIGDPRNTGEDYGEAFTLLRNQILPELRDPQGNLQVRTPAAVLRLVRYYDSALFRTLQSLVPARDNVSVGAIIDDNILHRNKYRDTRPETNLGTEFKGRWSRTGSEDPQWADQLTASIETVFIDGGEAGSLKVLRGRRPSGKAPQTQSFVIRATTARTVTEIRECPSVDYLEEDGQSIGTRYEPKVIFDDSPRFNGELLGTNYEVTNGELNEGNKFKRGGSSSEQILYALDYRFLCLPRFPVDTVLKAAGTIEGVMLPLDLSLSGRIMSQVQVTINNKVAPILDVDGSASFATNLANLPDTFLSVDIGGKSERIGGWLFTTGSSQPATNINYISPDPELDTYNRGEDFPEGEYSAAEGRRIASQSVSTILVPNGGSSDRQMVSVFTNGPVWEDFLDKPNRKLYTRTFVDAIDDRSGSLEIQITKTGKWGDIFEGESIPLEILTDEIQLYRLDNHARVNLITLASGSLQKIFVRGGEERYATLDFSGGTLRKSSLKEAEGIEEEDYKDWKKLKGFQDEDTFNIAKYLDQRYKDVRFGVIGVKVIDSNTGLPDPSSGSSPAPKSTLMEPYMGCPYIFTTATISGSTTPYRLLIDDWA